VGYLKKQNFLFTIYLQSCVHNINNIVQKYTMVLNKFCLKLYVPLSGNIKAMRRRLIQWTLFFGLSIAPTFAAVESIRQYYSDRAGLYNHNSIDIEVGNKTEYIKI
jgi:hypothetical protein